MSVFVNVFKSLGDMGFYRTISQRTLGNAFAHIALLVIIYAVTVVVVANIYAVQPAVSFATWAKDNFPTATLANYQMTTTVQEPYYVTYEPLNLDFVFNTQMTRGPEIYNDVQPMTVVFEKDHAVYIDNAGKAQEIVYQDVDNMPAEMNVMVDAAFWERLIGIVKTWATPVVFLFSFVSAFFVYLTFALLAAVFGLLVNSFIRAQIGFKALYILSVFALTLANVMSIASLVVPILRMPLSTLLWIIASGIYVVCGLMAVKRGSVNAA